MGQFTRNGLRDSVQLLQTSVETPCDGAWIIKPENRRYLSGFSAEDNFFTESSGSLLINGTNRLLITDSRYTLPLKMKRRHLMYIR
jgi:Xaa-Pro aminopeptidase